VEQCHVSPLSCCVQILADAKARLWLLSLQCFEIEDGKISVNASLNHPEFFILN